MKRLFWVSLVGSNLLVLSACGPAPSQSMSRDPGQETPPGLEERYPEGSIVVAEARLRIEAQNEVDGQDQIRISRAGVLRSAQAPVTVTVQNDSRFEVDASQFGAPETLTYDSLSFGSLLITDFFNNDLRICGSNGRTKCGRLQIRMYTDQAGGAGLYNGDHGYGLPVYAKLLGTATDLELGWTQAQSQVVQEVVIPASKNVVRVGDFALVPQYDIHIDFTNAGVGSYETEVVLESILAL